LYRRKIESESLFGVFGWERNVNFVSLASVSV